MARNSLIRRCERCGTADPSAFSPKGARCRLCEKDSQLRSRYGLSLVEYEKLFLQQRGVCAICRQRMARAVDHDHATGRVRGLLCFACNKGIGLLGDDPIICARACFYLAT